MTVATRYEHIVLDEKNVAYIEGTKMKLIQLVLNHLAYNWSPDELHEQHPHLTMGQIHSALAYYWDHKEEIDQEIDERHSFADKFQHTQNESKLITHLKAKGFL